MLFSNRSQYQQCAGRVLVDDTANHDLRRSGWARVWAALRKYLLHIRRFLCSSDTAFGFHLDFLCSLVTLACRRRPAVREYNPIAIQQRSTKPGHIVKRRNLLAKTPYGVSTIPTVTSGQYIVL